MRFKKMEEAANNPQTNNIHTLEEYLERSLNSEKQTRARKAYLELKSILDGSIRDDRQEVCNDPNENMGQMKLKKLLTQKNQEILSFESQIKALKATIESMVATANKKEGNQHTIKAFVDSNIQTEPVDERAYHEYAEFKTLEDRLPVKVEVTSDTTFNSVVSLIPKTSSTTQTYLDSAFMSMTTIQAFLKLESMAGVPISSYFSLAKFLSQSDSDLISVDWTKGLSLQDVSSSETVVKSNVLWGLCQQNQKLRKNIQTLSDQLLFQIEANANIKKMIVRIEKESNQEFALSYHDCLTRLRLVEQESAEWMQMCQERQQLIEQALSIGIEDLKTREHENFEDLFQCKNCALSTVEL